MHQAVFVNRTINMKRIKYIGLDMDHTLIRYRTQQFEALVYRFVVEDLIKNKQYPPEMRTFTFDFGAAIRGSVVDSRNGNILKLNRFAAIRKSYHGTQLIQFNEQQQIYRSTYVDLNDDNYIPIDTSFSIAFCVLFGQIVGFKDKNPGLFPSYETIAFDVLQSVDSVHAEGHLKQHISQHLEEFVLRDPAIVQGLQRYKALGKKLFILTNSDYAYSKLLLDYAITTYLEPGESWQDLFEYVITLSNKPRFFYDNLHFLKINPLDGSMTNVKGAITPGLYQGGNAKQFTDELALNGDEILYIGDHIYGDILRLKKDCNWRTALVVEELGAEIQAQNSALPIEQEISQHMHDKQALEQDYAELQSQMIPSTNHKDKAALQVLHDRILSIDKQVAKLIAEQDTFFNPKWGRVFRAGAEESYFAYQVERYACIYMEKLVDLLNQSPWSYFRAKKRAIAHDIS